MFPLYDIAMGGLFLSKGYSVEFNKPSESIKLDINPLYRCILKLQLSCIIWCYQNTFRIFIGDICSLNDWEEMQAHIKYLEDRKDWD